MDVVPGAITWNCDNVDIFAFAAPPPPAPALPAPPPALSPVSAPLKLPKQRKERKTDPLRNANYPAYERKRARNNIAAQRWRDRKQLEKLTAQAIAAGQPIPTSPRRNQRKPDPRRNTGNPAYELKLLRNKQWRDRMRAEKQCLEAEVAAAITEAELVVPTTFIHRPIVPSNGDDRSPSPQGAPEPHWC